MRSLSICFFLLCAMPGQHVFSLQSYRPACGQALCIANASPPIDKYGKTGALHDGVVYPVLVTLGNPSIVSAPLDQALTTPCSSLKISGSAVAVLKTTGTTLKGGCTFTLQNQNTQNANTQSKARLVAQGMLTGEPMTHAPASSAPLPMTLPNLQTCTAKNAVNNTVPGMTLSRGAVSNADLHTPIIGKPLANYTSHDLNSLYPEGLHDYTMHDHVIALSIPNPALFSPGSNQHIDGTTSPSTLNETTCSDAAAAFHKKHPSPSGSFVEPYTHGSIIQTCNEFKQTRIVHYAVPNGTPPSKAGWPVIIMFHGYEGQEPPSWSWYYLKPGANHITDSLNAYVFNNHWDWSKWELSKKKGDSNYNYYVRMRLIQAWLSRGFAVIVPSTWNAGDYDSWSYEPGINQPWPYTADTPNKKGNWPRPTKKNNVNSVITYLDYAYWPGFDKQMMQSLMTRVMDPKGFDPSNANSKMDFHNLFLFGYSAGSNMVSRLINEFPKMTTTDGQKFPAIKAAVILSGGSYSCYSSSLNSDVCPAHMEENYDSAPTIANHPPTLIAESLHDNNAGKPILAGTAYYNRYVTLCRPGTACAMATPTGNDSGHDGTDTTKPAPYRPDNQIQIIHTAKPSITHAYFPEMVIPSMDLMLKHTCVPKAAAQ